MMVWGGRDAAGTFDTGGIYDPGADSWTSTSMVGAPTRRFFQTAVWTGERMLVWGGVDLAALPTGDGGRYDPLTDTWESISLEDAPSAREQHSAVWDGTEMIIWGGWGDLQTGGRYTVVPTSGD